MKPTSYARIATVLLVALTFAYSTQLNLSGDVLDSEWDQTKMTVSGIMGCADFPVTRSGIAPMMGDTSRYHVSSVLTIENVDGEPVYLQGGRHEMIGSGSTGNSEINGVTFDEINDAFTLGLEVQVSGTHYRLKREGETYNILKVEDFKVIDPDKLPLIIYDSTWSVNLDMDMTELHDRMDSTDSSTVGRVRNGSYWKQVSQVYQMYLRDGEVFEFNYTSSRPITLEVYVPKGYNPSNTSRWGDLLFRQEERKEYSQSFQCHIRGIYTFVISGGSNSVSDVEFTFTKKVIGTDEVFFLEEGGTSCWPGGGMGYLSFLPRLPSTPTSIGRSMDNRGYWCDNHREYKVYLEKGQDIRYQFNGTAPLKLSIIGPDGYNTYFKGFYQDQILTAPNSGIYEFGFTCDYHADLSFRAHHLGEDRTIGDPSIPLVGVHSNLEYRPPSWIPQVQTYHYLSTLGLTEFPMKPASIGPRGTIENHLVLTISEVDNRILHFTGKYECASYPEGGDSMKGATSLFDLVACYENNITMDVCGFPYTLEMNGTSYKMFHIFSIDPIHRVEMPVSTYHSVDIVSGRFHQGSVYDGFKTFPVSFRTGLNTYNSSDGPFSGYTHHYFNVYLENGEKIHYRLNTTGGIQFILYRGFGIRGFNDSPDKYIIVEKGDEYLDGMLEVSETGSYYFGVRGYGGQFSDVTFDLRRVD